MSLLSVAGDVFKLGLKAAGLGAKEAGKALWELVALFGSVLGKMDPILGCLAGTLGYGYASSWVHTFGGGDKRRLSNKERQVMSDVFSKTGYSPHFDDVWVITSANLSGIPGNPAGLCLGYSVYLRARNFATCDVDDEAIEDYHAFMSVLLHELVHVAQYQARGRMKFACEYGRAILARFSTSIPFEWEAGQIQNEHHGDLLEAIHNVCAGETASAEAPSATKADWFWIVWS
jgi:hypothetical protein